MAILNFIVLLKNTFSPGSGSQAFTEPKLALWQFYSYFLYEFLGNLHRISFQVKQFMNERLNAGASNKHQIQI